MVGQIGHLPTNIFTSCHFKLIVINNSVQKLLFMTIYLEVQLIHIQSSCSKSTSANSCLTCAIILLVDDEAIIDHAHYEY